MTTLGLEYLKYKESQRSNMVREHETNRNNLAMEQLGYDTLNETKRSNLVREDQNQQSINETKRSNLVRERQNQQSIDETARHNRATESVEWSKLHETQRHNQATEAEAQRHNVASENLQLSSLAEQIRANKESERIRDASNITQWNALQETMRHNSAMEENAKYQTDMKYAPSNVSAGTAASGLGSTFSEKASAMVGYTLDTIFKYADNLIPF